MFGADYQGVAKDTKLMLSPLIAGPWSDAQSASMVRLSYYLGMRVVGKVVVKHKSILPTTQIPCLLNFSLKDESS